MNIQDIIFKYQKLHSDIVSRKLDGPELNDTLIELQSISNLLESERVHSLLAMYKGQDFGKNLDENQNGYIAFYIDDKDGEVYDYGDIVVDGTKKENSLLDDVYLYIPYNTRNILIEIVRGNIKLRIVGNANNVIDEENGVEYKGQTTCYYIVENLQDSSETPYVPNPITFNTEDVLGRYIYPFMEEDGQITLSALETE